MQISMTEPRNGEEMVFGWAVDAGVLVEMDMLDGDEAGFWSGLCTTSTLSFSSGC